MDSAWLDLALVVALVGSGIRIGWVVGRSQMRAGDCFNGGGRLSIDAAQNGPSVRIGATIVDEHGDGVRLRSDFAPGDAMRLAAELERLSENAARCRVLQHVGDALKREGGAPCRDR